MKSLRDGRGQPQKGRRYLQHKWSDKRFTSKSHAEVPQGGVEKLGNMTEEQTQLDQTIHQRNYPSSQ